MPEKIRIEEKNFAVLLNKKPVFDASSLIFSRSLIALADDENRPSVDSELLGMNLDSGDVPNFDEKSLVNDTDLNKMHETTLRIDAELQKFARNLELKLRDVFGFNVNVEIIKNLFSENLEELYGIFVYFTTLVEVSSKIVRKCVEEAIAVTPFNSEIFLVEVMSGSAPFSGLNPYFG